jgi:hypothetical protein
MAFRADRAICQISQRIASFVFTFEALESPGPGSNDGWIRWQA